MRAILSKYSKFCLIICLAYVFLISCSENEIINLSEDNIISTIYSNQDIVVKDQIVHFKNLEVFKNTMDELHTNGRDYLIEWENKMCFDNSLRSYYENDSINEFYPDDAIIPDPFFASVVNKDGLFVIADSIHKITYETEYVIPNYDIDLLKTLNRPSLKSVSISGGIIEFKIERGKTNSTNLKSVSGWNTIEINSPCGICWLSAHLKCWCVNFVAYSSVGIRISGRKANNKSTCSNFRDDSMWYAGVDGCAWARPSNFPPEALLAYCGSTFDSDKKNVDKTLLYQVGTSIYCERIECNYYYSDDGVCFNQHWFEVWQ